MRHRDWTAAGQVLLLSSRIGLRSDPVNLVDVRPHLYIQSHTFYGPSCLAIHVIGDTCPLVHTCWLWLGIAAAPLLTAAAKLRADIPTALASAASVASAAAEQGTAEVAETTQAAGLAEPAGLNDNSRGGPLRVADSSAASSVLADLAASLADLLGVMVRSGVPEGAASGFLMLLVRVLLPLPSEGVRGSLPPGERDHQDALGGIANHPMLRSLILMSGEDG